LPRVRLEPWTREALHLPWSPGVGVDRAEVLLGDSNGTGDGGGAMTCISEATRDRALSDLSRHYANGTIDLVDLEACCAGSVGL
jgi:hypothetical protein